MIHTQSVLLCGATGLVGGQVLKQLVADPDFPLIIVLVRKPLEGAASKLKQKAGGRVVEVVADFGKLSECASCFAVNSVIFALGTTIKKAGSEKEFRRVDFDFALETARLARDAGARHFAIVTAMGADPNSSIFYNRIKGEIEGEIRQLGFPHVTIVRPSLLRGKRRGKRLLEILGKIFLTWMPGKYRAVKASKVAAALIASIKAENPPRLTIHESGAIQGFKPARK